MFLLVRTITARGLGLLFPRGYRVQPLRLSGGIDRSRMVFTPLWRAKFWNRVMDMVVRDHADRFRERRNPDGLGWRVRGDLIDTGRLMRSIKSRVPTADAIRIYKPSYIVYGTRAPYARHLRNKGANTVGISPNIRREFRRILRSSIRGGN